MVLVDDNEADLALLREGLREIGASIELQSFTDADAARQYFAAKATNRDLPPPDLVLVDYYVRGKDGTDLVRYLRGLPAFAAIPVYLYTADARCGLEPIRDVEPTVCLRKPSSWDDVIGVASRLASEIQSARAAQHPPR